MEVRRPIDFPAGMQLLLHVGALIYGSLIEGVGYFWMSRRHLGRRTTGDDRKPGTLNSSSRSKAFTLSNRDAKMHSPFFTHRFFSTSYLTRLRRSAKLKK
jgi:hypothetical protein